MANMERHSTHSDEIDLGDLLRVLFRGWKTIAFVFVLFVILGGAYAFLGPATYESRAFVSIKENDSLLERLGWVQDASVLDVLAEERLELFGSNAVLLDAIEKTQANTSISTLNKIPLLGSMVARFQDHLHEGLEQDGRRVVLRELRLPFSASKHFFILERTADGYQLFAEDGSVLVPIGVLGQEIEFEFEGQPGRIIVDEILGRVGTRFKINQVPSFDTLAELKDRLDIEPLTLNTTEQHYVVKLRSDEKFFGVLLLEALVESYVAVLQKDLQRMIVSAEQELESSLSTLQNNLLVAEQNLQSFKEQNPDIQLSAASQNLLNNLLEVEIERAQLELQRNLLRPYFDFNHIVLEELNNRLEQLRQRRDAFNDLMAAFTGAENQLLRLQRDVLLAVQLENVFSELLSSQLAASHDAQDYVHAAMTVSQPEVVSPKRPLVLAVSALLGIMLGVFIVLIKAFWRPMLYRSSELQEMSQLGTLAIPDATKHRGCLSCLSWFRKKCVPKRQAVSSQLLIDWQPNGAAIEGLRTVRAVLDNASETSGQASKMAFLGATDGVGATFISANIASLFALEGKRVLLVDANLHAAKLHNYFNYEKERSGLVQLLSGQLGLNEVLFEVRKGLSVLSAGQRLSDSNELLLQPTFSAFLQQAEKDFDYIIIVAPAILSAADSLVIARNVDVAYFVARAGQTTREEAEKALERLQVAGVTQHLSGAILNRVDN